MSALGLRSVETAHRLSPSVWFGIAVGLALLTAFEMRGWFLLDRLPGGDFAGYAASLEQTSRWLKQYHDIPAWCSACYGGTSVFTSHLKEIVASPLAWVFDSVLALKLAFALLRFAAALSMAVVFCRLFGAPWVAVAVGAFYGFGSLMNYQNAHLEVAFAAALFPSFWLASVRVLEGGGRRAPVVLGVLAAVIFCDTWVQAVVAGAFFALLWLFRPVPGELAGGTPRRVGMAVLVALALCASALAWLQADSANHRLISPDAALLQAHAWRLESPLLLFNRDGVLGPFLVEHPPVGPHTASMDPGSRYVGWVALAIAALGWFSARKRKQARRYYQLALLLFGLQLNLAAGPYGLAEQLGWRGAGEPGVLLVALGIVGVAAAWLFIRSRKVGMSPGLECGAGLALLVLFFFFPFWMGLREALPALRVHRSPGHFAALLAFPSALLFGLGLRELTQRVNPVALRGGLVAVATLAVLVDHAPSMAAYDEGRPLSEVRAAKALLAELPGEAGTVRTALSRRYGVLESFLAEEAPPGHAWGWLPWQAGRYWPAFMRTAVFRPAASGVGMPTELLRAGRIRYFVRRPGEDPFAKGPLAPPWKFTAAGGGTELWELPDVGPYAAFYPRNAAASAGIPDWVGASRSSRELAWEGGEPGLVRVRLGPQSPAGWVFLSESHHPWWVARVDGVKQAEVQLARPAFMAVAVPPGSREVEYRFERPGGVVAADTLTAVAWIAVAVGLVWPAARRARRLS